MIVRWSLATISLLVATAAVAQDVNTDKGKLSYAIGYEIGRDFTERKMDVDISAVIRALQDGYAKKAPAVPDETMRDMLGKMQDKMRDEAMAKFKQLSDENKAKSAKFLADNKVKKGIATLPSGVQYRVIEEGSGAKRATAQSEVTVHYRGSLASGLEFDSSFARGEPVHFKVDSVIKGWQEVLPLMKAGDHWQIFVPPDLAYGDRGQPPRIGPNEALVFEIKLVEVK